MNVVMNKTQLAEKRCKKNKKEKRLNTKKHEKQNKTVEI